MKHSEKKSIISKYIHEYRNMEYTLGKNDCFSMAVSIIEEITGKNIRDIISENYSSIQDVNKLILKHGSDFKSAISNVLDISSIDAKYALVGDVVLYHDSENIPHIGISYGGNAVFKGKMGMVFVSLKKCDCCWRLDNA